MHVVLKHLFEHFIQPLDKSVQSSNNLLLTHLQEAYWLYLDYFHNHKVNKSINFRQFVCKMTPFLKWTKSSVGRKLKRFWKYCERLPRCGGILLNHDKTMVLLVRGYKSNRWGFPVGKVYNNEDRKKCAQREVFEETGYFNEPSNDVITYKRRKSVNYLYIYYNVPIHFYFSPQTRKEIAEIQWVPLNELYTRINTRPFINQLQNVLQHQHIQNKVTQMKNTPVQLFVNPSYMYRPQIPYENYTFQPYYL